jgi:hypothetical protein
VCQRFGGTYGLNIQGRRLALKREVIYSSETVVSYLYGVKTRKTNADIFTTETQSDLI